ncbi:MAG: hypothetical protein P1V18_03730 [Candidatus Gracilibacteria bacterium]|nr:hypothetical protein [Candidatus Gracilibacteria bacterium]
MRILRLVLLVFAVILFGWNVYAYTSIDEMAIKATVSGGVPVRFIQADQETLEDLNQRLRAQKQAPSYLYDDPKERLFGREGLFLPDEG